MRAQITAQTARKKSEALLCFFPGFGLLRGPALALRVGDPLARFSAQHALLSALSLSLGRGLRGLERGYFGGNSAGAGEQRANLCKPCNLCIDLSKN